MKITINDKQIELTPTQEATIKEALGIKENRLWKPKNGDEYWYIDDDGCAWFSNWDEKYGPHKLKWEIGNVFPTKEATQKHRDKFKSIQRVKEYIAEHSEEFTPDWDIGHQDKFTIIYNYEDEKFVAMPFCLVQTYWPFQYLASEKDAQKVIDNCEADLKVIFDIK